MIYSQRRKATGTAGRGRTRLLIGAVLLVVAAGTVGTLRALDLAPFGIPQRHTELLGLWNSGEYRAVAAAAGEILTDRPFDAEALTFAGFAAFYIGVEQVERADQLEAIDRSIVLLRKAMHIPRAPLEAERDYVLGKAYYHRGGQYLDLSVRYLKRSLERGHEASDVRTYLGLAYAELGMHDESVVWFERALANGGEQDVNAVRLKAAESYVALERYDEARVILEAAIGELDDEFLILLARNQLASVLILDGMLAEAERLLDRTIERFPESADAYYYQGIVHAQTDRPIEARDFWRTAIGIDPDHTESLRRLANNWEG